eukprot:11577875-Ditylum_brightwellii.AAC.1
MDQKFEKIEALLTTIQGELESNNKVADTKLETLHSSTDAPEMLIKTTELDTDFTRKFYGRIRRRKRWERSPK